ncbi:hypothetical protein [Zooshikella sp. RANM57]|uniref:hypothetical protein n=1 Tax=Zooshikella sp. RANM57 TaxID=3425863 RepID=UPI003D6FFADA
MDSENQNNSNEHNGSITDGKNDITVEKVHQSLSQSAAIAVQDATDQMRNVNTISLTAIGMAMAQMLSSGDVEKYEPIIDKVNALLKNSTDNFNSVGDSACEIINKLNNK